MISRIIDPEVADCKTAGYGVRVAVIDSGWDRARRDSRVAPGVAVVAPDGTLLPEFSDDDMDSNGHGTACINLILNGAPLCTVIPVKVFGAQRETSPIILARAIDRVAQIGVKVANLSLGTLRDDARRVLYEACERARRAGVILVAAAGNKNDGWSYPAVFEPVLGVGVTRRSEMFGIEYVSGAAVECRVPMRARRVQWLGGRSFELSGTSFEAPVITSLIVRLVADQPSLDLAGVRDLFSSLPEHSGGRDRSVAGEA
jgi:subtilisin